MSTKFVGNDQSIYTTYAHDWWTGRFRWLRTLQKLVPARLRYFDRFVDSWSGKRVLDLGCGGGFMAEALAHRGAIVTGVEPARAALEIARTHAEGEHLRIDYVAGTGESIPAADAAFDIVVCVDVLEHVQDLGAVLGEIRRVLAPGGLFCFDTINRTLLGRLVVIGFAERVFRLLPRGTHDFRKFIRPIELRALLEAHGFGETKLAGLGPRGLDRKLDFVFGGLPTQSVMYLGCARRDALPFESVRTHAMEAMS